MSSEASQEITWDDYETFIKGQDLQDERRIHACASDKADWACDAYYEAGNRLNHMWNRNQICKSLNYILVKTSS